MSIATSRKPYHHFNNCITITAITKPHHHQDHPRISLSCPFPQRRNGGRRIRARGQHRPTTEGDGVLAVRGDRPPQRLRSLHGRRVPQASHRRTSAGCQWVALASVCWSVSSPGPRQVADGRWWEFVDGFWHGPETSWLDFVRVSDMWCKDWIRRRWNSF